MLVSRVSFGGEPDTFDLALLTMNLPVLPIWAALSQFLPGPNEKTMYQHLAVVCLSGPAAWGLIGVGLWWLQSRVSKR